MSNEKSKNNFVKYLIFVLLVIFVLSSINGILSVSNRYNLIVGKNKKLSISGFLRELNEEKQKLYSPTMSDKQLAFLNSRKFMIDLVNRIVDSDLFELEVENFCIWEPDELVLKKISEDDRFKAGIDEGMAKLSDFLKKEKITEEEYMDIIRKSDNLRYLLSTVSRVPSVNNLGIDIIFHGSNSYRNVKLFSIDGNSLKSYLGEVSDDEVKHYYNSNIHKFVIPDSKKIDYVTLTKYLGTGSSKKKLDKIRSLLSSSKNIEEFAKALDIKVETLGYMNRETLVDNEKYAAIVDVFDLAINGLTWLKKIGNDIRIYSVVDVEKGYMKDIEKVKGDVITAVKNEKTKELRRGIIQKYIDDYRNNSSSDEVLTNHGFRLKRIDYISRNYQGYEQSFIKQVLTKNTGEVTDIFYDKDTMYFAIISKVSEFNEKNENYVSRDKILESTFSEIGETFLKNYSEYLRNVKYKIKVKYNLLDLIGLN